MITTTPYEKLALAREVRAIGARRVLEIGAFRGETTRVLADAVGPKGRVVVIDPMRWSSEVLRNGIGRHVPGALPRLLSAAEATLGWLSYEPAFWRNLDGPERAEIRLHRGLSTDASLLNSQEEDLGAFDAVFIDGDHRYEGAKHDLEHWGRRVRKGGLVFVHDATPRFPGVVRALEEWGRERRVELEWPVRDSLCVARVRTNLGVPVSLTAPVTRPPRFVS